MLQTLCTKFMIKILINIECELIVYDLDYIVHTALHDK